MDIDFLSPASSINMNENDLFKTIKGQNREAGKREMTDSQGILEKELETFKRNWSKRSKEDLLEALLKIKKCELEMRFGHDSQL
tara:strand:+ start:322 stop:573 length:252 start_codon:yes stop_codon:yes gene_type:complete